MNKVFDYSIPIICAVYFLLILKGTLKLPPERQLRFEKFIGNKKKLMIFFAYIIIAFSVILAANNFLLH